MSNADQRAPEPPAISFAPPFIDEATVSAVERVLRSGWITTGPETAAFEQELARYLSVDHVVCGGSWTGLAGVVLDWFGVGPGDEVIIPAYTYCATANVVLHRGATPVMIDLPEPGEQDGLNITWKQVEARLTPRTKVVMPVDIGGWPVPCADWRHALEQWSAIHGFDAQHPRQHRLGRPLLLSDAAHAFGSRIQGASVGAQADISVFSFHAVKNLTTAEGGAASICLPEAFDSAEVHRTLKSHCLHGQSKDAAAKFQNTGRSAWRYDVTHPGFKCNMTDIQAAMGRVALGRYDADLTHRQNLADVYDAALADMEGIQLPHRQDESRSSADHLYTIRLDAAFRQYRDDIMESLAGKGIATNVHFPPLPALTAYAERGFDPADFPHAMRAFEGAISLPIHRLMTPEDALRVAEALQHEVQRRTSS